MSENRRCVSSRPSVAIAAVASTVPEHCIDQQATRDIVLSVAPELRSHEALFLNTGIRTRYSCVPLEWHFEPHGWAARNGVFQEAAASLLERVARECIDRSGVDLAEVEAIVTVSTTGLAVPSLDAILANRLGLPATIERLPIFGLGCAGGVSDLREPLASRVVAHWHCAASGGRAVHHQLSQHRSQHQELHFDGAVRGWSRWITPVSVLRCQSLATGCGLGRAHVAAERIHDGLVD